MDNIGMQFGLMNTLGNLTSGFPVLSLVLCSLVPSMTTELPRLIRTIVQFIARKLFVRWTHKYYTRKIVFSAGDNMNPQQFGPAGQNQSEEASTERNNILQKAIRLYINKDRGKLSIQDAELYLLAADADDDSGKRDWMRMVYGRGGPNVRKLGDENASLKRLQSYSVTRGPQEHAWLTVDAARDIEFRYSTQSCAGEEADDTANGKGKGRGKVKGSSLLTTFEIRSQGLAAEKNVDAFVDEALDYYKSLKAANVDKSRYFFLPVVSDDSGGNAGKGMGKGGSANAFKKYLLSEHKTFDSLFFPEKEEILKVIDDFLQRRNKFAIPGFPNKLGLLLYGPPGTGKTSLIKSIAQYTKRHIVDVSLAKVKTNQELFDYMFDLVFAVPGEDEALRMDFSDIVFVMEDVDAASKVVYKRKDGSAKKEKAKRTSKNSDAKADAKSVDQKADKSDEAAPVAKAVAETDDAASAAVPPPQKPPKLERQRTIELVRAISIRSDAPESGYCTGVEESSASKEQQGVKESCEDRDSSSDTDSGDEDEERSAKTDEKSSGGLSELVGAVKKLSGGTDDKDDSWTSPLQREKPDALNLSGLLNILDGCVDSPGRILVMTTNHPKKLDPALIRPGRINFAFELGFMKAKPLCQLCEHVMQATLTEDQRLRANRLAENGKVTPAKVEQCCAESDSVDALLKKLESIAIQNTTGRTVGKRW